MQLVEAFSFAEKFKVKTIHFQYEQYRLTEEAKFKDNIPQYPKDLFFTKQTIHNACGTCALIHAISNNKE